jgi:hypothetical protein
LFRLLPFLCGGHHHLALENLALRQQLAVYKRTTNRLRLRRSDRLLWVWLSRVWPAWRQALVIVAPATVLSWQRAARPSKPRSKLWSEVWRRPIPCGGAPRIHGELLKLGIDVAERTVSRLLPKRRSPPSQTWRTFLTNHVQDLVSVDFFTVPQAAVGCSVTLKWTTRRRAVREGVHDLLGCPRQGHPDSRSRWPSPSLHPTGGLTLPHPFTTLGTLPRVSHSPPMLRSFPPWWASSSRPQGVGYVISDQLPRFPRTRFGPSREHGPSSIEWDAFWRRTGCTKLQPTTTVPFPDTDVARLFE